MKSWETNDGMVMNSIIYKIYSTENLDEMRQNFIEQLRMIMDFDSAIFYLADKTENKLVDPVYFNCYEESKIRYDIADFGEEKHGNGKCLVYRESDLINEEERNNLPYYMECYRPNNWNHAIQMVIGKDKHFLGMVTFYRTLGKADFHYEDISLLNALKEHLSYILEKNRESIVNDPGKLKVSEAVAEYGLTKREHTILKQLVAGKENDVICDELGISVNTLKKHILNIYRKLGIRNRVQMFKKIKEYE